MLATFGLDETAAAVYRFLLRHDNVTAQTVSERLRLPGEIVAASLDTLRQLSMVWNCDEEEIIRPSSPERRLAGLAATRETEALERYREARSALVRVDELAAEYERFRAGHAGGSIEMLACADHTRLRIAELTALDEEEVLSILPGYQIADYLTLARIWKAHPAGPHQLPIRSVFPESVVKHPRRRRQVQLLTGWGIRMRTITTVPARMVIVGRRAAILQADMRADDGSSLVVHNPGVIAVLRDYFERVWEDAEVASDDSAAQPDTELASLLNTTERAALAMLAEGMTDEAVARKLDVSVRTVRRMIANLTRDLGARSRFEVAVLAAKRGWV